MEDKDNIVLEEVRKLNRSISKLHAELTKTKNVNNLLLTRLSTLTRQCWANVQYSRRECLDIVGIPRLSGEDLEEKVLNIFEKLGCDITLLISNKETNNIMKIIKVLEESGLLIKGIS